MGKALQSAQRAKRLEQALRENLRRRKAQARDRAASAPEDAEDHEAAKADAKPHQEPDKG